MQEFLHESRLKIGTSFPVGVNSEWTVDWLPVTIREMIWAGEDFKTLNVTVMGLKNLDPCHWLDTAFINRPPFLFPVMPSDTKPQLTPYDEKIIEDVVTEEGVSTENLDPSRIAEEKALVRKLDFRILPIACLLYLCACE